MSYSIFYRHQFISLPDGTYLPYIEVGSSNCYEYYYDRRGRRREKRERSWWVQKHPFEKAAMTPQEIQTALDDRIHEEIVRVASRDWEPETDPAKIRKNWGYYVALSIGGASTRRTTAASYINFFTQGVAYAKPVEYFGGLTVRVHPIWGVDMEKAGVELLPPIHCKTGEEAIEAIRVYQEKYGQSYWGIDVSEWKVEEAIAERPKQPKLPAPKKEVDKYYVVALPDKGFYIKATKNYVRYSHLLSGGRKFASKSGADRVAERVSWLKPEVQLVHQPALI